jgi:hypothetical protein
LVEVKIVLSDDLLQMIDDIMFDNLFVAQHRFEYYEPSDNEDDVDDDDDDDDDVDDDNDVDDEIIHHVPEFGDASRSSFVVSRDWALVIDVFQEGLI